MSLVLVRIDDRLIHGQVVEGWLRVLQADRIVVASDEAAGDPIQVGLMSLAVPPQIRVQVMKVEDVSKSLLDGQWTRDRVLLLLPGVREARRLAEAGVPFDSINLGGLHDAPGRKFITPSLALSQEDRDDLLALLQRNIFIETRALPNDERRSVINYLSRPGDMPGMERKAS